MKRPASITCQFRSEIGHIKGKRAARIALLLMVLALTAACGEEGSSSQEIDVGEMWRGVFVGPEERCVPYDRRDYAYNSRVLEAELVKELGGVYAPYTGRCLRDPGETDVEHIVALSEAHDSGMCGLPQGDKARFAGDLLNLTLASPEVNREEKRHYDAAEWVPDKNRCWFAARVVAVRKKYGLTIDEAEAQALEAVLGACESTDLVRHCTPRKD